MLTGVGGQQAERVRLEVELRIEGVAAHVQVASWCYSSYNQEMSGSFDGLVSKAGPDARLRHLSRRWLLTRFSKPAQQPDPGWGS